MSMLPLHLRSDEDAAPLIDGLATDSARLAQRGSDAVQHAARQWRDQAHELQGATRHRIERDPLKAVLLAVTAGAVLMVLGGLIARGRRGWRD